MQLKQFSRKQNHVFGLPSASPCGGSWRGAPDEGLSHCPSPLFRPAYRRTPSPKGEGKNRRLRPSAKCPHRAPRRAGWRRTPYRSINTRKRQNRAFAFFTLQRGAAGGKIKPRHFYSKKYSRHFYSKKYSKKGKITLFPFFPYEHTDGGECGAHKKWRALKTNRAPENRSKARFLGKRSGRCGGQGGKQSAPPAMAP